MEGEKEEVTLATWEPMLGAMLSDEERKAAKDMLQRSTGVFAFNDAELGEMKGEAIRIGLNDDRPVYRSPYKYSPPAKEHIKKKCAELLQAGRIEPVQRGVGDQGYASPTVAPEKKDIYGEWRELRMCGDYRRVNGKTVKDQYQMPTPEDIFDAVGDARVFSNLDLRSGYHQLPLHESDRAKTTFWGVDANGHDVRYQWRYLPFGLRNAPAEFQRVLDRVLEGLPFARAYIDDVLIFSDSVEEHHEHLRQVFDRLREAGLTLHPLKCSFFQDRVAYLGHMIVPGGLEVQQAKVRAILDIPPPSDVGRLRAFLGLANYYRRFVPNYSSVAKPLTLLTKLEEPWRWKEPQQEAFGLLKSYLAAAPRLARPNPKLPFELHTDWAQTGLGAVLVQRDEDGKEQVVAYASRSNNRAESNYSSYEGECLAVVWAVQHFRCYLWGRRFRIVTDHQPLLWLMTNESLRGKLARWALILQEFDFDIQHRSGVTHQDADGLSRNPLSTQEDSTGARQDLDTAGVPGLAAWLAMGAEESECCALCAAAGRHDGMWWPEEEEEVKVLTAECDRDALLELTVETTKEALAASMARDECATVRRMERVSSRFAVVGRQEGEPYWRMEEREEKQHRSMATSDQQWGGLMVLEEESKEGGLQVCVWTADQSEEDAALPIIEVEAKQEEVLDKARGPADIWSDEQALRAVAGVPLAEELSEREKERVKRRAARYRWVDAARGVLVRRWPNSGLKEKVVPPPSRRVAIILALHAQLGHFGVRRTAALVRLSYWWKGLYNQVAAVLRTCMECDRVRSSFNSPQPQLHPLPIQGMGYRWSFDLAGPLPKTERGNRYIMIGIEHFSKWCVLAPLPDKLSKHTAHVLLDRVLSTWGAPAVILTDQGKEFEGEFDALCHQALVDHRTTSRDHPECDGLAERMVQTTKTALRKYGLIAGNHGTWDLQLPWLSMGYNFSRQASLATFSPYQLVYGREPVLAGSLRPEEESAVIDILDKPAAWEKAVVQRAAAFQRTMPVAMRNLAIAQHRDTRRYAQIRGGGYRPRIRRYEPGDYVYLEQVAPTTLDVTAGRIILRVKEVGSTGVLTLEGRDGVEWKDHAKNVAPCHLPHLDGTLDPYAAVIPEGQKCMECGDKRRGYQMVLCDRCSRGWHIGCLKPPLLAIPEGQWVCTRCVHHMG